MIRKALSILILLVGVVTSQARIGLPVDNVISNILSDKPTARIIFNGPHPRNSRHTEVVIQLGPSNYITLDVGENGKVSGECLYVEGNTRAEIDDQISRIFTRGPSAYPGPWKQIKCSCCSDDGYVIFNGFVAIGVGTRYGVPGVRDGGKWIITSHDCY
ncbi:MAG: hypothetical protein ACREFF_06050 [Candidatus Udaeobacter sp.]